MGNKTPLYRIHKGKKSISSWGIDKKSYGANLLRDYKIREHINLLARKNAWEVEDIEILSDSESIIVNINSGKPGSVLGKNGSNVSYIRSSIASIASIGENKVEINVFALPEPEANATVIASRIARDMENRKNCNNTMKYHMQDAVRAGVTGIKVQCSGRLNGSEMASTLSSYNGKVPKHTIRSGISYALYEANTSSGKCGVKVWINHTKNKNIKNLSSFKPKKNVEFNKGVKL